MHTISTVKRIDRRERRPSVQSLARTYRTHMEALTAAWADYLSLEDTTGAEGWAQRERISEIRAELTRTGLHLLRAVGWNRVLWVRLRRGDGGPT